MLNTRTALTIAAALLAGVALAPAASAQSLTFTFAVDVLKGILRLVAGPVDANEYPFHDLILLKGRGGIAASA